MAELEHGVTELISLTTESEVTELPQSVEVFDERINVIELVEQGKQGIPGPPGPASFVSLDPNNMTQEGTDGGIFTPDVVADPVAYYILAKS